jgi:hypothetical protein
MNLHDIPREKNRTLPANSYLTRGLARFISKRSPYPFDKFKVIVSAFNPIQVWAYDVVYEWQDCTDNMQGWAAEWDGEEIDWDRVVLEYT